MHPDPDIESSAMSLWFDVFSEHVKRQCIALPSAQSAAAEEHAKFSAILADAAEAKLRERFARKPVSGEKIVLQDERHFRIRIDALGRNFAAKYESEFFSCMGIMSNYATIATIAVWIIETQRTAEFAEFVKNAA